MQKKKDLETARKKNVKDMDNNPQQPKGHKETGPNEEATKHPYNQQRDQEHMYNQQEEQ